LGISAIATAYTAKLMLNQYKKSQRAPTQQQPSPDQGPQQPVNPSSTRRRNEDDLDSTRSSQFSFEKEKMIMDRAKAQGMGSSELRQLEEKLLREKYDSFLKNVLVPYASHESMSLADRQKVTERLLQAYASESKKAGFTHWQPVAVAGRTIAPVQLKPVSNVTSYYLPPPKNDSDSLSTAVSIGVETMKQAAQALDNNPALKGIRKYTFLAVNKITVPFYMGKRMVKSDQDAELSERLGCAAAGTATEVYVAAKAGYTIARLSLLTGPFAPATVVVSSIALAPTVSKAAEKGGDLAQKACHNLFK
jgi:hypothetical protein